MLISVITNKSAPCCIFGMILRHLAQYLRRQLMFTYMGADELMERGSKKVSNIKKNKKLRKIIRDWDKTLLSKLWVQLILKRRLPLYFLTKPSQILSQTKRLPFCLKRVLLTVVKLLKCTWRWDSKPSKERNFTRMNTLHGSFAQIQEKPHQNGPSGVTPGGKRWTAVIFHSWN